MSPPAFDEILRRLIAADVNFVLVGGLALGARGVIRATKDIDIVPASDIGNLEKIAETAAEVGGRVQKGEALLGSAASMAALLAKGEQVAIETDLGRLDIIQGLPGVPTYKSLRERATKVTVLGVEVQVCSLSDLKTMKQTAGRTRDLADLEDLEAIEDLDTPH